MFTHTWPVRPILIPDPQQRNMSNVVIFSDTMQPSSKQAIKAILFCLTRELSTPVIRLHEKTNIRNVETDKTATSQSPNEHVDTLF